MRFHTFVIFFYFSGKNLRPDSDPVLAKKKTFDRGCFLGREIEFAKQPAAIWTFVDESEDLPTLQDINRVVD